MVVVALVGLRELRTLADRVELDWGLFREVTNFLFLYDLFFCCFWV